MHVNIQILQISVKIGTTTISPLKQYVFTMFFPSISSVPLLEALTTLHLLQVATRGKHHERRTS